MTKKLFKLQMLQLKEEVVEDLQIAISYRFYVDITSTFDADLDIGYVCTDVQKNFIQLQTYLMYAKNFLVEIIRKHWHSSEIP